MKNQWGGFCGALDRCDIGVKMRSFITAEGFFFFSEHHPPMKQSSHIHPQEKETLIKKVSSFAADLWELFPPTPPRRPPAPHPAQTKSTRYAKEGRRG